MTSPFPFRILVRTLLSAAVLASPVTQAQEAGGRGLQAGSEGQGLEAAGAFPGLSISVSDNWSIESFFRGRSAIVPSVAGSGAPLPRYLLVGQTLMGQYRFGVETQSFRPRLGAGLAYSMTGPDLGLGPAGSLHAAAGEGARLVSGRQITGMGMALEIGGSYALSKSWSLEGSLMKSYIRSSGSALGPGPGSGAPGLKIDPLMFSFSLGFRFQ